MSILELSYLAVCVIALYGYWTQVRAIMRPSASMKSVSFKTYSLWTFTTLLSTLYSIFENGDPLFIIVCVCNFLGCLLCAMLIAYRRQRQGMPIMIKVRSQQQN